MGCFEEPLTEEQIRERNEQLRAMDEAYLEMRNRKKERITSDGYFKGIKLCGRVKVLDQYQDFTVRVSDYSPDLRVQKVTSNPNDIGQWEFVDDYPDFKIRYVDRFEDLTIQFVDNYPGVN